MIRFVCLITPLLSLASLSAEGTPETPGFIQPVTGFRLPKYLGRWYEIARLDHWFERGLQGVTAEYSLNPNGSVRVVNRGWRDGRSSEAVGRAKLAGKPDRGLLKVSFFGPFYAAYVIFELGEDYEYAFVGGGSRDYLWLLARTPQISPELQERFRKRIAQLGYPVDKLIWVKQPMTG